MRWSWPRRLAALLAREEGFGIVEGVVAAMMLSLTAVAVYGSYDAGTRASFQAKQSQVELGIAQNEMERLRALPYQSLALTSMPAHDTDSASPLYRVVGTDFNLSRSGSNPAALVVNNGDTVEGGTVDPGPVTIPNPAGDVTVWRFIVWQSQPGCPATACSGQDVKRVVIVVQPQETASSGTRGYLEIHSDFIDPDANSKINPGTGSTVNQQLFYLSDASCNPSGPTAVVLPTDHPLHNTLGDCPNGTTAGGDPGAPDSLLLGAPTSDTDPPPDYENDLGFSPTEEGIQLDRHCRPTTPPTTPAPPGWVATCAPNPAGTSDCTWMADPSPKPQTRFHVWLSDEMPVGQPFDIQGQVTVSFFSRTLSDNSFPGKLCFWVFRRNQTGTQDVLFASDTTTPSFTYSSVANTPDDNWPGSYTPAGSPADESPHALAATANIGSQQVPPHWRLGLAVSVASDTPEPLAFMYDHSLFPAALSVDTTSDPLGP